MNPNGKMLYAGGSAMYALCAVLGLFMGCCGTGKARPRSVNICVRVDVDDDRYALVPICRETDSSFVETFHKYVEECDGSICEDDDHCDSDYYLVETEGDSVVALAAIGMERSVVGRIPFDRMAPASFGWLVCGDYLGEPKWTFKGPEILSGVCEALCRSGRSPFASCRRFPLSSQGEMKESCVVPEHAAGTREIALPGGVRIEMVRIPGRGCMMGKYEVTQALWVSVMGDNPSEFKGADNPVECVSWGDCQEFMKKLNALPDVRNSGVVFRLPTKDEWEYACRSGARGIFCKMSDGTEVTGKTLGDVAWYRDNSGGKTHPVGRKKPNGFGLYDVHGNVGEWTGDSYDGYSGGSWMDSARGCRSSIGTQADSSEGSFVIGFRLCATCEEKQRGENGQQL